MGKLYQFQLSQEACWFITDSLREKMDLNRSNGIKMDSKLFKEIVSFETFLKHCTVFKQIHFNNIEICHIAYNDEEIKFKLSEFRDFLENKVKENEKLG